MLQELLSVATAAIVATGSVLFTPSAPTAPPIASYIVVMHEDVDASSATDQMAQRHQITVDAAYSRAIKGFAARLNERQLQALRADQRVKFISEDRPVQTTAQTLPTGVNRMDAESGLATAGAGVGVAVIDTGIDLSHPDLAARIVGQKSCIKQSRFANDDNGHGTHVAGTIAAANNTSGVVGVSPNVNLVAVKVLNAQGSGTWSGIICGLDWVAQHASRYNIKVVNMSLGGSGSSDNACGNLNNDALHRSVCRLAAAGVTVVVAAGNNGANANTFVPAAYDDAVITVSALADSDGQSGGAGAATGAGPDDTFASFSNYGSVVDLGAPGVDILSTWKRGGYNKISGTSMASPHVAGAAARYVAANPGANWTNVRQGLIAVGEALGLGHTDPSGRHPEPVVKANSL
jgi:subtilisin